MNTIKKFTVYTDGSCTLKNNKNNLLHNCGGIGVYFDNRMYKSLSKSYVGSCSGVYKDVNVTNQSMELLACITAIEKIIKLVNNLNCLWEINIYTDSMYVINCINKWAPLWIQYNWKRKVGQDFKDICNLKLIKRLYMLSRMYPVTYTHVRSHQKEPPKDSDNWNRWYGNHSADKLANSAMLIGVK